MMMMMMMMMVMIIYLSCFLFMKFDILVVQDEYVTYNMGGRFGAKIVYDLLNVSIKVSMYTRYF